MIQDIKQNDHGPEAPVLLPDELGDAAEMLFANLCSRAQLVCNKSNRDRSGWDFIVDVPAAGSGQLLDQRQKTSCHVQLKATATVGSGSIGLKLSAVDLLAKGPHPAIIAVFRMRGDGSPVRGYLIHLLDEPLAKLLRRLREAEAAGRRNLHKSKIFFDYRKSAEAFELTPEGLRSAIERACGFDPATYASRKLRQLAELGYENGALIADAIFRVESDEHLTRVVLGLEPLRPVRVRTFDTRFGIPVPYTGDMWNAVEEITVAPPSAGPCEVAIIGPPLTPAATFQAELLFAFPFDQDLRILIRHTDFIIAFRETEMAFETAADFVMQSRSLDDLVMVLRALNYLATGSAELTISGADGRFGPLRLPIRTTLAGPNVEDLPVLAGIARDWQRLLELAGLRPMLPVTVADLWDTRSAQLAANLILRSQPDARFAFDAVTISASGEPIIALYFNSAQVAGLGITYCVEIELRPAEANPSVYRSVHFRPIEVRRQVLDLNDYMDELSSRFNHRIMIHPNNVEEVELDRLELPADCIP